ncbi:hypothetical protein C7T94_09945 [Pedobacter yulinensis]|uniref:Lipocalin-like domain-containing protein n=2 Tax=Pedobacter yulinensis TaxID=2126353 RepID=A0A2T3HKH2_9SPHI|nr:hypothetical protein C7T94_09945 [Pedobacter yulinensis]
MGLAACDKTAEEQVTLSGTYKGTFERRGLQQTKKAAVSLTFAGNSWEGSTDTPQYPALCNGKFLLTVNQVKFSNACTWPVNLDGSLILSGDYALQFSGEVITLTKVYKSGERDIYSLTKQ